MRQMKYEKYSMPPAITICDLHDYKKILKTEA
jgi:hypothetical protein